MRFIAQALQIIEHRILVIEAESRAVGHEKPLTAGITIGAFGNGCHRYIGDAKFGENIQGGLQLAQLVFRERPVGLAVS